jgi:hypothetical protein
MAALRAAILFLGFAFVLTQSTVAITPLLRLLVLFYEEFTFIGLIACQVL